MHTSQLKQVFKNLKVNDQIYLEPVSIEHAEAMARCMNHKYVAKQVPTPYPWNYQDSIDYIQSSSPVFIKNKFKLGMAIMVKDSKSDQFVYQGLIQIMSYRIPSSVYNEAYDQYRIGYCLDKSVWGKGIATLCCRKVSEHFLMNDYGIDKIETHTQPENLASQRVLEKSGFKKSGRKITSKKLYDYEKNELTDRSEDIECDIWELYRSDL